MSHFQLKSLSPELKRINKLIVTTVITSNKFKICFLNTHLTIKGQFCTEVFLSLFGDFVKEGNGEDTNQDKMGLFDKSPKIIKSTLC